MRRGRKSAAQTPAPKKDRVYGSKTNPKGSASSEKSAKSIVLSDKTVLLLRNKLKDFKEKHPNKSSITLNDLKAVYRRGLGAYSSSHRPTITGGVPNSRSAWATARVNKFLLKAGGAKVKAAYVQDDDLMADGGTTIENIKCINCGWHWNIEDSTETDKYICHNCNFDNTPYYQNGGLITPNGKPSNLTPEQYKLVRTPEFKAWFGDWENSPEKASKVVDENGEPKVMWHFSLYKFDVFNPNAESRWVNQRKENVIWFGGSNKVISYSDDGKKGYLYQCFLDAKNPILVDAKKYDDFDYYRNEKDEKTYSIQRIKNQFVSELGSTSWDGKKNTNDGVIFYNAWDNVPLGMVVAIPNPNQIKLADGTNTTFDANSPDIRFADGGRFDDQELLKKYKAGKSIGFTGIAHLKAKGLIPRADGTKRKSDKYKEDGGEIVKETIKIPELDMQYENLKETLDYQGYVLEPKFAKGGKLKGSGDCYYVAGKIAMGDFKDIDFIGTPYVVHAEVEGQGKISGIRYGHAWVEDDENVYDYSNGNEFVLPKIIYYSIGNIKTDNPKKYRRYTFDQARLKMLETRNYGCWDLDVKYADGGETEIDTVNIKDFESKIWNYKKYIDNQLLEKIKDKDEAMVKVITKHFDDLERKNIIFVLGGNAKGYDLEDISKKHNKSIEYLLRQYFKGLQDELVHVNDIDGTYSIEDFKRISQIVLDHLDELPNYYEVNKVVEQKIEEQKVDNTEQYLKFLLTMIELMKEDNVNMWQSIQDKFSQFFELKYENNNEIYANDFAQNYDGQRFDDVKNDFLSTLTEQERGSIEITQDYLGFKGRKVDAKKIIVKYVPENKMEKLWQSIKDKFSEVFYADTEDEKNEIYSNDVKAEEHIWMFDRYSPYSSTLSWADAKSLFLRKLTTEEKEVITIEYDVKNISEAFGLMWEKKILVKLKKSMADGGETTFDNISQEMVLEDYFEREKTLADALMLLNRSKIYKVMYCNKKIEYAEKEELMAESGYDKNAWNYVANIWKSTLGVIKAENTEYKHGGTTDCGCMHKYGKGGLAYGNSHDNGGIKATVASTGQSIEYEGGEGVINKRSMQIEKTYDFNGKKLTPCEIVSQINQMGGGVKFKCEDVKPIIANDGSYKN